MGTAAVDRVAEDMVAVDMGEEGKLVEWADKVDMEGMVGNSVVGCIHLNEYNFRILLNKH